MTEKMNELKKTIFHQMLEMAGRVFIVSRYSENVVIGKRGFTGDEKTNGVVLVFNKSMNFVWDEWGISSTLVFGTSPQKCFIPSDDIVAIYSPELNSQFVAGAPAPACPVSSPGKTPEKEEEHEAGPNVVKVDFKKKHPSKRRPRVNHE